MFPVLFDRVETYNQVLQALTGGAVSWVGEISNLYPIQINPMPIWCFGECAKF